MDIEIEVQDIDHLGLIAGIIDDIGIVEIIDQELGTHEQEKVSAGLVVRIGKTDKLALRQVEDNLKIAPINLLGLVINGDKAKLPSYNYYHIDYEQRVNEDENKLTISNL